MTTQSHKILILTADAGFGHRSAANAIEKALTTSYDSSCEVTIVNPLNHPKTPRMLKESQSDYDQIVKKLPDLYELGYRASDATIPATLIESGLILLLFEALQDILSNHKPDLIITTYPLYQAPLDAINQLSKHQVPFIATVTDLITVHRLWLHPGATLCMVPTEEVQQRAINAGIKPEQIMISGIPINPAIKALKSRDKTSLRESLGWQPAATTLLVVGGTRVTAMMEALKIIDHSGFDLQLVLVAGGNQSLYNTFQEIDWHHPAKIYNFVEEMPKFMRAADMIICKAGGLIVTEALASGLALMLIQALPGQEAGNAIFIEENGAGVLCETPYEILQTLSHWMINNQAGLKQCAHNASQIARGDAAQTVADRAWEILNNDPSDAVSKKTQKNIGPLKELLNRFKIPWGTES